MSSATPASIRQYRGRMARSILFTYISLSLLPLILAGGLIYLYDRGILNRQPLSPLVVVAILLVVTLALTALLMWLAARRLTAPLTELATHISLFIDGNWEQRAHASRKDESGLLATLFNRMANDLVDTYRLLAYHKAGQGTEKKGVFTQVSQAATAPASPGRFLEQALELIYKHFELGLAAVYLLEQGQSPDERLLVLRQKSGDPEFETSALAEGGVLHRRFQDPVVHFTYDKERREATTTDWLVAKAILSGRTQTAPIAEEAGLFEAAVPINLAGQTLGALNLFAASRNSDTRLGPFSIRMLSELQALAGIIALGLASGIADQAQTGEPGRYESPEHLDAATHGHKQSGEPSDERSDAQRRLAELQTLWNISQTISIETDLKSLFQIIHRQVETVMGELNSFAVALYESETDTIHIPYIYEEGQMLDIAPFPLGEGLTSIVVHSRKPLMLVEDAENKARQLGAITVGVPAKSWLGVPMLFSGEVIGVIIVQDIHREQRFNQEDQRLLSTLAAQVAVVVRNAGLLEVSRSQAELERLVNEITAKIRRSAGIQGILRTTADELGAALGARRAHIKIHLSGAASETTLSGESLERLGRSEGAREGAQGSQERRQAGGL